MRRRRFATRLTIAALAAVCPLHASDPPEPVFTGDRLLVSLAADPPGRTETWLQAFEILPDGVPVLGARIRAGGFGAQWVDTPDLAVSADRRFLFVGSSEGISTLRLDGAEGILPDIGRTPTEFGVVDLVAHPEQAVLIASLRGGMLVYSIEDDGSLVEIQRFVPASAKDAEITADGKFLYVAQPSGNPAIRDALGGFSFATDGTLVELPWSPFETRDFVWPLQVEIARDGEELYLVDDNAGVFGYDRFPTGGLSLERRRRFSRRAAFSLEMTPDDRFVYVGQEAERVVYGFDVSSRDMVPVPGSPYPIEAATRALIASPVHPRLYRVGWNESFVEVWTIADDGSLERESRIDIPPPLVPDGALYLQSSRTPLVVDIRPGKANHVSIGSSGLLPVAVLGTDTVDVRDIAIDSLRFGPERATPDPRQSVEVRDVNGDGRPDLLAHFRTNALGLSCGQSAARLAASSIDGTSYSGVDRVAPSCD